MEMTKDLGRWLGLLITDGTISKTEWFLSFGNIENELLDDFSKLTQKIFGLEGKLTHSNGRVFTIQVNSTQLVRKINKEFQIPIGNKSKIISVPEKIVNCNNNQILCSFLQGVFDGDGSVVFNKKHNIRRVDLTSGSKGFIEQIRLLLQKLGIFSRLSKTEIRLLITRKNDIKEFQKLINFQHPKRRKKLLEMLN